MSNSKFTYESPEIEILEITAEGVFAQSIPSGVEDYDYEPW